MQLLHFTSGWNLLLLQADRPLLSDKEAAEEGTSAGLDGAAPAKKSADPCEQHVATWHTDGLLAPQLAALISASETPCMENCG